MAKKKEDVWKPEKPHFYMPAYLSTADFIEFFVRGLESHFARSTLFSQEDETFHIEDLSYSAEFYAENFSMIMSAIDWKESKNAR